MEEEKIMYNQQVREAKSKMQEKGMHVDSYGTLNEVLVNLFRDVLELARMIRPVSYDLHFSKARLLVPRYLRFEVSERIGAGGEVVEPLTGEELQRIVDQVKSSGAQAVAVSCLFSFLNPQHEREIGEALRKGLPGCHVCLS